MENSYRFFANRDCRYYPCHEGIEELNCLFCYCPMYALSDCPGSPRMIKRADGSSIKDCSACIFPHRPENYDKVLLRLKESSINVSGGKGHGCK